MAERIDDLQIKGYRIIQNPDLFCFGVDAVLLADFARVPKNGKALDLGTGNGVIPMLMEARNEEASYVGLEIQEESASLARRSIEMNGQQQRISVVTGDIKNAAAIFGGSTFDTVTVNPPYMNENHGLINDYSPMAIARHELLCTLEDIIENSAKILRPGGNFFMIHRPHRLVDIISLLRQYRMEPKKMRFVQPFEGKEPTMVLIEASRGGKAHLKVLPPLIIHKNTKEYTEEIYKIYGYDRDTILGSNSNR